MKPVIKPNIVFVISVLLGCLAFANQAVAAGCQTTGCHDQGQKKVTLHPRDADCKSCHMPLIENHPKKAVKNFKQAQETMCIACHDEMVDKKNPHEAIKVGKCTVCHNPHAAARNSYLGNGYTSRPFINYDTEAYALCFSCHKRELLRFADTSFATGFRDGEKNLHYLHVNKQKNGRNCNLCHKIHNSSRPKLIAEKVSFGKWQMPLHFTQDENGGSCTPGCHKPVKYGRNK